MAIGDAGKESSGRDILVDWANKQDHWLRALVAEVLSSRRPLTEEGVTHFHELLLREKELATGDPLAVAPLGEGGADVASEEPLILTKMANAQNVNALANNQEIEFNPSLTVLFGENGAGKSGYVRILKAVASVRTMEPILPDVRKAGAGGPSVAISFRLGDKESTLNWRGEQGQRPLTRLDVFDSRGLVLHVDEDLTYVYSPGDVALFRIVHDGAEAVRKRLEQDRDKRRPEGNPFLSQFPRDAALFAKIETLGAATIVAELESLAVVSGDDEAQVPILRERVDALRGPGANDRLRYVREELQMYRRVHEAWGVVARLSRDEYAAAVARRNVALQSAQETGAASLQGSGVPGVLAQPWRDFVDAAERYIRTSAHRHYPAEGDDCAYCRQPLGSAARELLGRYRAFSNSQHKQDAAAAEREARAIAQETLDVDTRHLGEELLRRRNQDGNTQPPPALVAALGFVQSLASVQEHLVTLDGQAEALAELQTSGAVRDEVALHLRTLEDLEQSLGAQAADRERRLRDDLPRLRQLEARLILRDSMPRIRRYVEDAQWVDRASKVAQRFQGTLRSLTEASKVASEQLLNQGFESRFRTECELLKAPAVTLEFPGKKGAPARRKTLSPRHRLSDILSEGEQKVIAFADFLAEATLRGVASPIVLDDPITSLDYKRMKYVVTRIVELSRERQVIVFTHNIWFTMELLGSFERNDVARISYFDISESDGSRGLVSRASSPRLDSWGDKSKRINKWIESVKKEPDKDLRDAFVEKGYEDLRGACEIIVEKDMFQQTVQSYAPNVMVAKLKDINVSALPGAIEKICEVHDRCCRFIASHKQPLETLNVRPKLVDLEKDWKVVQEVHAAFKAKGTA